MSESSATARVRELGLDARADFVALGHRGALFFPHHFFTLPKYGPDGYRLAERMCGSASPEESWEVVLYAGAPHVDEVPDEAWFDDELVWHQQQFGRRGQIATANLVIEGDTLTSMVHVSDLVQRIGRRRDLKTRVENRFKGWPLMLLNAVMNVAMERGLRRVRTPGADLALLHTDRRRNPGRELFERVYDRSVQELFDARRDGDWWAIDVEANRHRVLPAQLRLEALTRPGRAIAICHDIERGLGHLDVDAPFARTAEEVSRAHLATMLECEEEAGARATYCVVGSILDEERHRFTNGHALGFHSWDHDVGSGRDQLELCRAVDYRLKGYRTPRSILDSGTSEERLLFHNFEWLACSAWSFGFSEPRIERRIVKIPIAFDDFPLYKEGLRYETWEAAALERVAASGSFIALGLHDCYGSWWLPHYRSLLGKLAGLGTLVTFDDVAADLVMRNAC